MDFKLDLVLRFLCAITLRSVVGVRTSPYNEEHCGLQRVDTHGREGASVQLDELPWMAALIYQFVADDTEAILCSGALINRKYVLTAAQCLARPRFSILKAVRLGEHNTTSNTDCVNIGVKQKECTTSFDFEIDEKIIHSDYDLKSGQNDVALLGLKGGLNEFTDYIRPICLPDPRVQLAKVGDTLVASGWGRTARQYVPVEVKKKTKTILIPNEGCAKAFKGRSVSEKQLCTSDAQSNRIFTCSGDAGAPVIFANEKRWHLEGIVSWGKGCGGGQLQVHTKVVEYLDWIKETMEPFCSSAVIAQDSFKQEVFPGRTFCGYQHSDDYLRKNDEVSLDEFPWLAALIYKFTLDESKAILCSGTLINQRYVLTAAQCLGNAQMTVLEAVRLGEYNIKTRTDCVSSDRLSQNECNVAWDSAVEEKIVHSDYDPRTGANDIALIRLATTVEYSDYIRPICLPFAGTHLSNVGDIMYFSGWGRKSHNNSPVTIKKKVYATLLSNDECKNEFKKRPVTRNHLCTKNLANNTAFSCAGDAGAPLVSSTRYQWYLEGILSWGGQCGSEHPEVSTKVSRYLEWIRENIFPWE